MPRRLLLTSALAWPSRRALRTRTTIPDRKRRPTGKALRSGLLTGLGHLLDLLFSRLSWSGSQRLGRAFGRCGWRLARRDRRRTLDHLAFAFPELSVGERTTLAEHCFAHLGTLLGECLYLRHCEATQLSRHVELAGWEHVEAARTQRRPVIIVTGHCGNWELLAAVLNAHGLGMLVVAREIDEPGLQTMLLDLRARFGTRTIVRGTPGAARALLGALRGAGALGMLIDQDTKVEGVFVDFFGRPAWTPVGAAELALRFDAAVLPTFIERRADGSHRAVIHPELPLPTDPTAATALMTAAIEAQIRSHPDQWVWLHRRWRKRPAVAS
ncbi:MAG: lysophospholipid acyltransferase family protein [Thermoanaerobaculia bacterium]